MTDTGRASALYQEHDTITSFRTRLEGNGFETRLSERPTLMRSKGSTATTTTAYVQIWTTAGWASVGPPFTGTS